MLGLYSFSGEPHGCDACWQWHVALKGSILGRESCRPIWYHVCVFKSTRLLVHMLNVRLFVRWGRHRGKGTHLRRVRLHRAQVCCRLLLLFLQLASILMQLGATLCDINVMSLSVCQRLDGLEVHHQSTSVFFIESALHVLEPFQSLCRVVYVVIVVSSFRCYCSFK